MPRADCTTASTAPRIDQGATPPDSGGAGPGLGPEPVIPGCARSFRITAGSCSVATRRGRPPRCAHARCIKAAQCQARKPLVAFVPPMCPSSLRSAPAPRPGTRAPRDCTRPRAGASGRAQSTRCDSGSWASRRPSLADCIRGPTAPPRGAPAAEGASVVYARNTQSDSHFPRRFPDPVPSNSHVTRSLKTGPRGGAA
jgi:hypothetical protein